MKDFKNKIDLCDVCYGCGDVCHKSCEENHVKSEDDLFFHFVRDVGIFAVFVVSIVSVATVVYTLIG